MSVFVEWTRTVQDHFVRLQKLLGRGRELLINWEAPMASTFISSFSAQGALGLWPGPASNAAPHGQYPGAEEAPAQRHVPTSTYIVLRV